MRKVCLALLCSLPLAACKGSSPAPSQPDPPTLDAISPAGPANENAPTLSGTAVADRRVGIFSDASCTTLVVTTTADGSGAFSVQTPVADDSSTTFYAAIVDDADVILSDCVGGLTFVEDSTSPGAPVVTGTTPPSPNIATNPAVEGTCEDGSTVALFTDSSCAVAEGTSGTCNSGAFSLSITVVSSTITEIFATATDEAGNVSSCSTTSVTYVSADAIPTEPTVTGVAPVSPSSNNNPTVSGTATDGDSVQLFSDPSCSSAVGSPQIAAGGSFDISVMVADDSSTTFYAQATDTMSITSPCSGTFATYVEDSTAPAPPDPTGASPGNSGNVNDPLILGTAEEGATVQLYSDDTCMTTAGSPAVATGGNFSIQVTVGDNTFTRFYGIATDAAGNASPCSTTNQSYLEDSIPPGMPTVSGLAPGPLGNDNNPRISGTTDSGTGVQLYTDSTCATPIGPAANAGGGTFDIDVTVADNTTTDFYAQAVDTGGNLSPCSTTFVTYTEDSSIPGEPTFSTLSPGLIANDNNPVLTGTAEEGGTVQLYTDDMCTAPIGPPDVVSGGMFTIQPMVADDTTTDFYATVTDSVGNTSPCSTDTLMYIEDSTAPDPPVVSSTVPASPSSVTVIDVEGTHLGSVVQLHTNNTCTSPIGPATNTFGMNFSISVTVSTNTTTTFYAETSDTAGNTSDCSSIGFDYVHDSIAPAPATFSGVDPGLTGNDNTPTINGAAEDGAMVQLYTDACVTAIGPATAATGGSFGIDVTVADDSVTTFRAIVTDAAGNGSGCSTDTITYTEDSLPPAIPTITGVTPDSPADADPTVEGTTDAGANVQLYIDATCVTAVGSPAVATGGNFAITVSQSQDTTVTYYARSFDAVGNLSGCSSGIVFERNAPPVLSNLPAVAGCTIGGSPSFTATATDTPADLPSLTFSQDFSLTTCGFAVAVADTGAVAATCALPAAPCDVGITVSDGTESVTGILTISPVNNVYRVDPDGGGVDDPACGTDWGSSACATIQYAVNLASSGDQVWLDTTSFASVSTPVVTMAPGVSVYGGFLLGEATLFDRQAPFSQFAAITRLLGGVVSSTTRAEHVVIGAADAVLDNVYISGGSATGTDTTGGGIAVSNTSGFVLSNVWVSGNEAQAGGGGLTITDSDVEIYNAIFAGNFVSGTGAIAGGAVFVAGASTVLIDGAKFTANWTNPAVSGLGGALAIIGGAVEAYDVEFRENHGANSGGAVYLASASSLTIDGALFERNSAAAQGGGLANFGDLGVRNATFVNNFSGLVGGGMTHALGTAEIVNTTFDSNRTSASAGTSGGGALVGGNATLVNLSFVNNESALGGGLRVSASGVTLANSVFWGNSATTGAHLSESAPGHTTVSYTCIPGSWTGVVNVDLLADPFVSYDTNGDGIVEHHLKYAGLDGQTVSTVCADAANITTAGNVGLDLTALSTASNYSLDVGRPDTGRHYDPVGQIWYVDVDNVSGNEDGLSWATAFPSIQDATDTAQPGDQIWVAEGTYNEAIVLENGDALFGGFDATENSITERSTPLAVTLIDGDLTGNGTTVDDINILVTTGGTNHVDGLVLSGAENRAIYSRGSIVSMRNLEIADNQNFNGSVVEAEVSCLRFDDVRITNTSHPSFDINHVIETFYSVTTIYGSTFDSNDAFQNAGLDADNSTAVVRGTVFTNNTSNNPGSAVSCNRAPACFVFDNIFFNNTANNRGGAVAQDQARHRNFLIGNLFVDNESVTSSGGAVDYDNNGGGEAVAVGNTFAGNVAATDGGAIGQDGTTDLIASLNVFWGNTGTSSDDNIEGPTVSDDTIDDTCAPEDFSAYGSGNIDLDNSSTALGDPFNVVSDSDMDGVDEYYLNHPDSACIDAGTAATADRYLGGFAGLTWRDLTTQSTGTVEGSTDPDLGFHY